MKRRTFMAALAATAMLQVGVSGAALADDAKPLDGQHLSVLLPPWGTFPKEMTDQFTAETGVALESQTLGWDEIHTKIVTSMIANTAPASATEVDWSWVGQFGAAGWYSPLNDDFSEDVVKDVPTSKIFNYNGKLLALPYNNDFRVLIYNKAQLEKAGVAQPPKTPDELLEAAKAIKAAKIVDYPIGLPLSATEGTSTTWYLLTKAFGGDLFDKDFNPLFLDPNSGGYKALNFEVQALKDGLIDPSATGLKDVDVQELFKSGKVTFDVAGWAGNLSVYGDPSKSQVADDVSAALMPSTTGTTRTIGLPEAIGIPVSAENADAAKAFIKWMLKPETQINSYNSLGNLPPRLSVLKQLEEEGKLTNGKVLLEQAASVEPLFADGTPGWYPEFSSAVSAAINQAAKGQVSVEDALQQIADAAQSASQQ
ncbi:sugar ABC transporter substrate-binding protein [Thalassospira sp. MCCC 1A01428]|uniref:ABC transporter substrate-binding protein n=1 Tax=Thalassospira sp. MCCC 1A01428 TaxID=1470575 RepID=UPI000A1FD8BB|nr:sugar ABC transporter substrate-binding protein [Thalassospira sp. MCCC 1A01428]OSQ43667.1 ABC transporter substrate-binding protein [Thalassospira sp. MCCC 1A01428]